MAAAVARSAPAPIGRPSRRQANDPNSKCQKHQVGLTQAGRYCKPTQSTESDGTIRTRGCRCARAPAASQTDSQMQTTHADRVHQHECTVATRSAQQADPGKHRRGGGGIHEREEPVRLRSRIDVQSLAYRQAHLIPQAIVLGREPQEQVGDRESREYQHRADEPRSTRHARSGPIAAGFRLRRQAGRAVISAGSAACPTASSRRSDGRLAGAIPFASFDVMSVGSPL